MTSDITTSTSTSDIDRLVRASGPFASVYLPAPSAIDDAGDRLAVEWRNARRRLGNDGAPDALLDRIESIITTDHGGGASRFAIVAADGTEASGALPDTLQTAVVRFDSVPHLMPLLVARRRRVPHLVVSIDRIGADVTVVGADEDDVLHIDGETQDITRSAPGGWSQRRFQQRAENTWEDNARDVADAVADVARSIDAAFVAVSGDVRAVGFFRQHLPDAIDDLVVALDGSRHAPEAVDEDVERVEADRAARLAVDVLRQLRGDEADDMAVRGAADVHQALRRHQVATLVVAEGLDEEGPRAYVMVEDRSQIALDPSQLVPAAGDRFEADAVDATIVAALITGADVVAVPATPTMPDGLAALLRFAES